MRGMISANASSSPATASARRMRTSSNTAGLSHTARAGSTTRGREVVMDRRYGPREASLALPGPARRIGDERGGFDTPAGMRETAQGTGTPAIAADPYPNAVWRDRNRWHPNRYSSGGGGAILPGRFRPGGSTSRLCETDAAAHGR